MTFELSHIDPTWTLFLDRDGVINLENKGTYVRNWDEFVFYPNAPENIAYFNTRFRKLILATNQRGVTRGIMSIHDLEDIHLKMMRAIENKNGRIDKIYYCLDMDAESACRKPNPGMAIQAAADFPDIKLGKSLMVGNNVSDMLFGRNAGMKTVFLQTTDPETKMPHQAIDFHFPTLDDFAKAFKKSQN